MRTCIAICAAVLILGFASQAEAAKEKDKRDGGARRLEDIHIEGEIPVPQVLFVTGRDQRRFMDFQHRRYLKTSLEVGRATVLPSWITLVGNEPGSARKETTP
jgi:hypothetical protein